MFDFHMHTKVSNDACSEPEEMAAAAAAAGLKEICFTDHMDYELGRPKYEVAYTVEAYNAAYDGLKVPGLAIRNGVEIGMTPWNMVQVNQDLSLRHYDFVLGSVHYVDNLDPYQQAFWQGKTVPEAEQAYFECVLECVSLHDNFDVLGHLTFISKAAANPAPRRIPFERYRDIAAEIMKVLVAKRKGIEVNTSGVDAVGDFLPGEAWLQLYKDLGGRIVTMGSDAHSPDRVGQHLDRAAAMLKEIFGYVCTYRNRKPEFHKL